MERGTVISGAEKEVVDVGANDELPIEVVKVPSQSECRSCLTDMGLVIDVGANDELPSEVVNVSSKSEYWSCLADTVLVGDF